MSGTRCGACKRRRWCWIGAAIVSWWDAFSEHDASSHLPNVQAPTLVLSEDNCPFYLLEIGRDVAARIPESRFALLRGDTGFPFIEHQRVIAALDDFLGSATSKPSLPTPVGGTLGGSPTTFRTLLFTDLESSTALTQSLGDAKAQDILNGHNEAVRTALSDHGGEEVKHTGDGIFAAFGSAVSAVEASLQIQQDLAGAEVRVRIGLNAGEPIAQDDDYFGAAVQLAARVCDRAEPGQVLVAQVVRDLCRGKTFHFDDQGEATLKGFPEPVRLFVVAIPD
jgi:class 3 adenylate cyclase